MVVARQRFRPELEGHLGNLAGEPEWHLVILVVHRRAGVRTNVEGLIDGHEERNGVWDRFAGTLISAHRQDAGAALAGAGAVIFEVKHDGVLARRERRRALPAEP